MHIQFGWLCQADESGSGPAGRREGQTIMNYRRIKGLFGTAGAAAGALAVGTEIAQAQEDLGASIANAVTGSVSSIATNSGGNFSGGVSTETNSVDLGEQTGTAIADASGGNNNVSFSS